MSADRSDIDRALPTVIGEPAKPGLGAEPAPAGDAAMSAALPHMPTTAAIETSLIRCATGKRLTADLLPSGL